MRKEYRRAVRRLFIEQMQVALPQFELCKVDSPLIWAGETVFVWKASADLHCFVLLVPNPSGFQSFTVELGWSWSGRFPEASSRPTHMLAPTDPDPRARR